MPSAPRLPEPAVTLLPPPGESPLLVVGGYESVRAIDGEHREVWSADAPFSASYLAAGGGVLVSTYSEGLLAAHRLPTGG